MHRLVVCGFVALSGSLLLAAATAARDGATMRLRDRSPVIVSGAGFERGERVRVTLIRDTSVGQMVRAGRAGALVVTFADVSIRRCDRVRVVAIGGRGSRATLKILPPAACQPLRVP